MNLKGLGHEIDFKKFDNKKTDLGSEKNAEGLNKGSSDKKKMKISLRLMK